MKKGAGHAEQLPSLKRIEGQMRGIQRMIEEDAYCIDILVQLHAIVGAILSVEDKILKKHLNMCFTTALKKASPSHRAATIKEVVGLLARFRRPA